MRSMMGFMRTRSLTAAVGVLLNKSFLGQTSAGANESALGTGSVTYVSATGLNLTATNPNTVAQSAVYQNSIPSPSRPTTAAGWLGTWRLTMSYTVTANTAIGLPFNFTIGNQVFQINSADRVVGTVYTNKEFLVTVNTNGPADATGGFRITTFATNASACSITAKVTAVTLEKLT